MADLISQILIGFGIVTIGFGIGALWYYVSKVVLYVSGADIIIARIFSKVMTKLNTAIENHRRKL